MEKKILTNESLPLVDALVSRLITEHKGEWNDDNTILTGTLKNGGTIIIKFPDNFEGEFLISFDKKGKVLYNLIEKKEGQIIKATDLAQTVFKNVDLNDIKNGRCMYLGNNLPVLQEFDAAFKAMGFKNVEFNNTKISDDNTAVATELTLLMAPRNFRDTGDSENSYSMWKEMFRETPDYYTPLFESTIPRPVDGEAIVDIKNGKAEFGKYYVDRNIVFFYAQPFKEAKMGTVNKISDNKYIDGAMQLIGAMLKELKLKTVKSDIGVRILVADFNKASKKRIEEMENNIKRQRRNITDWEQNLTQSYRDILSLTDQIGALTVIEKGAMKNFMEELKSIEDQQIVEKVELSNGCINITFQPATIKANLDRNLTGDKSKGVPFEAFVGRITVRLKGDGSFTATCDHPCGNGAMHPHISEDTRVCLGDESDGSRALTRLLGERKLTDFVYVFWMFIKTWRYQKEHYASTPVYIDDRLKKGLPVFDQKGNRVTINDPVLIKAGVFHKLEKETCYEDNIKLYKNFTPQ